MIRPLRQRHRRMAATLAVALPVAFAAAIAARNPMPTLKDAPSNSTAPSAPFGAREWHRANLFTKVPVQVDFFRGQADSHSRSAFGFTAANDFVKPDLLVYWVPRNSTITDTLPGDAELLGKFQRQKILPLPSNASSAQGVLVFYSLAEQEVVDVSKPIRF
jgi:hypothetical protein